MGERDTKLTEAALSEPLQALRRSVRDPIRRLALLSQVEEQLKTALLEAVRDARRQGCSWAAIGAALKVSKQAAWQGYKDVIYKEQDDRRPDRARQALHRLLLAAAADLETITRNAARRSSAPISPTTVPGDFPQRTCLDRAASPALQHNPSERSNSQAASKNGQPERENEPHHAK